MVCSIIRTSLGEEPHVKVTIDLEQGVELFKSIGKMMRLREKEKALFKEMAMSVIHHKAVLADDADPERISSIVVLYEKGLYTIRRAFRVAADSEYRENFGEYSGPGKKYKLNQCLGPLASQIVTDDDWESFTIPILILREERKVTLNTQHARFLIQYLVPRMLGDNCAMAWYKNSTLRPWEEDT